MSIKVLRKKEEIEKHLLDAMKSIDEATGKMLSLGSNNDEINASKIMQAKSNIKKVLQRDYDRLARNRNK